MLCVSLRICVIKYPLNEQCIRWRNTIERFRRFSFKSFLEECWDYMKYAWADSTMRSSIFVFWIRKTSPQLIQLYFLFESHPTNRWVFHILMPSVWWWLNITKVIHSCLMWNERNLWKIRGHWGQNYLCEEYLEVTFLKSKSYETFVKNNW